ncbi:hypothetical protein JTB14_027121 [Gonioctena quinquepunctata]|nr:hypothetical protein JTB14_027121 [Gonioctena quinquepunctata]
MISNYNRKSHAHGGVSIFARNDKRLKPINVEDLCTDIDAEFACSRLVKNGTVIVSTYRYPNGNSELYLNKLEALLEEKLSNNSKVIVVGAFNFNYKTDDNPVRDYRNIFSSYDLAEQVFTDTRVTETSSTRVDNVFTNLNTSQTVKPVFYADDATYLVTGNNNQETLTSLDQSEAISKDWFTINCLTLNETNTQNICFSTTLRHSEPVKLLGVYLDSKLDFSFHSEDLCKRLAEATFGMRQLRIKKTQDSYRYIKVKLYNALPHSYKGLTYNTFKKNVHDMLMKHCFYTAEEFLLHMPFCACELDMTF